MNNIFHHLFILFALFSAQYIVKNLNIPIKCQPCPEKEEYAKKPLWRVPRFHFENADFGHGWYGECYRIAASPDPVVKDRSSL